MAAMAGVIAVATMATMATVAGVATMIAVAGVATMIAVAGVRPVIGCSVPWVGGVIVVPLGAVVRLFKHRPSIYPHGVYCEILGRGSAHKPRPTAPGLPAGKLRHAGHR